jgi:hypothetical protein
VVLHSAQAAFVAVTDAANESIGINALLRVTGGRPTPLALILLGASILALAPIFVFRSRMLAAAALLPSQSLFFITAGAALVAAIIGQYADGYAPNGGGLFIFVDQLPCMAFAIQYSVAVYRWTASVDSLEHGKAIDAIVAEALSIGALSDDALSDDALSDDAQVIIFTADDLRDILRRHVGRLSYAAV